MMERNTYDMSVNETRHDEFAWLQFRQRVFAIVQAMVVQDCFQLAAGNVFLDPANVSFWTDGHQTSRQCLKAHQRLGINHWAIVDSGGAGCGGHV